MLSVLETDQPYLASAVQPSLAIEEVEQSYQRIIGKILAEYEIGRLPFLGKYKAEIWDDEIAISGWKGIQTVSYISYENRRWKLKTPVLWKSEIFGIWKTKGPRFKCFIQRPSYGFHLIRSDAVNYTYSICIGNYQIPKIKDMETLKRAAGEISEVLKTINLNSLASDLHPQKSTYRKYDFTSNKSSLLDRMVEDGVIMEITPLGVPDSVGG